MVLFFQKKNNIENILLDEGMRVIVEKLDKINVFKKINHADVIEETLKKGKNSFEMSNTCKQKIQVLNKYKKTLSII